jgi:hypothetical protein
MHVKANKTSGKGLFGGFDEMVIKYEAALFVGNFKLLRAEIFFLSLN